MRALSKLLPLVLCLAFSSPTHAQDLKTARALFNAGATAYRQEKYVAAIQAFEQAYELSKRPGLVFSIAQSYRKQYFLDQNPANLQAAVTHYENYLQAGGERRADANQALAELRPLLSNVKQQLIETRGTDAMMKPPPKVELTQLSVNSPTPKARLILDGKDRGPLPFIEEIEPGERHIQIVADGFIPHERTQKIPKGELLAVDVALVERPAQVTVKTQQGARISVDGRLLGPAPTPTFPLTPGSHFLTITQNGSDAFAQELELGRDQRVSIDADLEMSTQRVFAWSLLGAGAAGLATGASFGTLALLKDSDAKDILKRSQTQNISESDRLDYLAARKDRDAYRTTAWVGLGAGGALALIGSILFIFDEPRVPAPMLRKDSHPNAPQKDTAPSEMEIGFVPALSPAFAGAAVTGKF